MINRGILEHERDKRRDEEDRVRISELLQTRMQIEEAIHAYDATPHLEKNRKRQSLERGLGICLLVEKSILQSKIPTLALAIVEGMELVKIMHGLPPSGSLGDIASEAGSDAAMDKFASMMDKERKHVLGAAKAQQDKKNLPKRARGYVDSYGWSSDHREMVLHLQTKDRKYLYPLDILQEEHLPSIGEQTDIAYDNNQAKVISNQQRSNFL